MLNKKHQHFFHERKKMCVSTSTSLLLQSRHVGCSLKNLFPLAYIHKSQNYPMDLEKIDKCSLFNNMSHSFPHL